MDFITIVITLAVLTGLGAIIYVMFFEDSPNEDTVVDAGDVTLLATGMQNPSLGVAAYTAGLAHKHQHECSCDGSCDGVCDCDDDLGTIDIVDTVAIVNAMSNAGVPNMGLDEGVPAFPPPASATEMFAHTDLGNVEPVKETFTHVDLGSSPMPEAETWTPLETELVTPPTTFLTDEFLYKPETPVVEESSPVESKSDYTPSESTSYSSPSTDSSPSYESSPSDD